VNTKFRNIKEEYEESILKKNLNNQKSSREQSNISNSRFQSEISKSNANNNQKSINREMSRSLAFDQVNAFICYNCDKADHMIRNCQASRKMNLNNFVRKIEKNVLDQDQKLRKE
jgi:hypothetical protein